MDYTEHFKPNVTPQSEQADPAQAKNSAGGYSFAVDNWKRMERFLILGAEGGSYYATERKLVRENAKAVEACLSEDAARAVELIAKVSEDGRAPKNDAAIFALALAACAPGEAERRLALAALPRVCRIGTHLFQFIKAVDGWRGWGRSLRRSVGDWYNRKTPESLAYEVAKYQSREGWSHKDLLAKAHVVASRDKDENARFGIYRWVSGRGPGARKIAGSTKFPQFKAREYPAVDIPEFLVAFDELKTADEARTIALIQKHGFTHEMIDTRHKNSPEVWEALLEKMPPTAMIRNLAKMTAVGLLKPMSAAIQKVAERLVDRDRLKKARVHPIQMLSALMIYKRGHGEKGSLTWEPVSQIVDALDAGFYEAFGALEPSGKRMLLALDVSGSMEGGEISGCPGLSPRVGAAVMAMVTARTEKQWHVMAFADTFRPLAITPRQRLDDVVRVTSNLNFGGTDCALPMIWATKNKVDVDCFAVYTDSETWAGNIHPHQALAEYRKKHVKSARSVVVGMVANEFSIADPKDAGQLDVIGFDTAAPQVIADFAKGG